MKILRVLVALGSALAASAAASFGCSSIPDPAPRVVDGATESDAGEAGDARVAFDASGCPIRGVRTLRGYGFLLSGDKPGTQLLAAGGSFTEGDAGPVIYQIYVTGVPGALVGRAPVDLASPANADLGTCQYCGVASGGCTQVGPDAVSCENAYQAIAGEARAITIPTMDGGTFWVEAADLLLVKVTKRDGFHIVETDPTDCIALDRLTLEGTALQLTRPCSPAYEDYCKIADTASQR